MSKLETNTIDTVSGTANLTIGGANNTGSTTIKTNNTNAVIVDSSQNLKFNSGIGSVQTAYGCRAWVKFDGTGLTVNGSGNVSSVADNGTGVYVVNFSTSLPTHYQISAGHKRVGASAEIINIYGFNTGSINVEFFAGGSLSDTDYIGIAVHR